MRTLRLHHELYSARALDETLRIFAEHAVIDMKEERPYFVLTLTAGEDLGEDELIGELANYALALTAEEKRGSGPV